MTGYALGGENLMQGGNNSVLTRIKDATPGLLVLKCYCHTFHLFANHASKTLSKTDDQLIRDVYNYFKLSPNRQKSNEDFQNFEAMPNMLVIHVATMVCSQIVFLCMSIL